MAQPITFPRPTFAKLSPHPFLLANLQPADPAAASPARTNGRAPREARPVNVNAGSLSHAHGSAVVRAGDTTVICGVRTEVLPIANIPNYRVPPPRPDDDDDGDDDGEAGQKEEEEEGGRNELRDYDLVVPNIELATGSAPQFLPGVPPTTLAQTLSSRVYSLLHASGLLNVADLRIWDEGSNSNSKPGENEEMGEADDGMEQKPQVKAYWVLYIDVLFISFDGNPFDVAWTAVVAALRDTRLPRAVWDAEREAAVCSRADGSPGRPLSVRGLPVACTAAVFRGKDDPDAASGDGQYWVLLDPDRLEESLCDEFVTVVVDRSVGADCGQEGEARIQSMLKAGGTAAGLDFIGRLVEVAETRWRDVRDAINTKA
ncbi:exosome complex exonuclease RRP43 [Gaeumannomyces tritici R3-111a-1]|uniref:Ribosomal RNA-processing protein 43 n=1 Tax=Gaeumannomyces tritici (strain R3-111a-1) TaxID=644352 RepID=J3PD89_GAET3|nr:exosome complex exonuclease RRP43 [Gaeumannomyces tritici R3-111a-1]EJT70434.1 exosome complex exonuclease RRP43 [Gaeumannomyces tritici R3-111a-1]